jgi:hypothetical protein
MASSPRSHQEQTSITHRLKLVGFLCVLLVARSIATSTRFLCHSSFQSCLSFAFARCQQHEVSLPSGQLEGRFLVRPARTLERFTFAIWSLSTRRNVGLETLDKLVYPLEIVVVFASKLLGKGPGLFDRVSSVGCSFQHSSQSARRARLLPQFLRELALACPGKSLLDAVWSSRNVRGPGEKQDKKQASRNKNNRSHTLPLLV